MNRLRPGLVMALMVLSAAGPAVAAALPAGIQEVLDRPEYRHSHFGMLFVDLATGESIVEHNADKFFAPASVTKLFSTAAALDEFGADHRFNTRLVRRGDLSASGVLDGDLILVASGDPTLGGRTDPAGHLAWKDVDHTYANWTECHDLTAPDPLAGLMALARAVAVSGVRELKGDVLIDDRLFDAAEGTGSGPSRLSPVVVNDNVVDFRVSPGAVGGLATVEWRPRSLALSVDARVTTGETNSKASITVQSGGAGRCVVRGSIPAGSEPLVRIQEVPDAAAWARSLLIEALKEAGVELAVSPLAGGDPDALPPREVVGQLPVVASLESPRFAENMTVILKVSHNLHAGMLPLLMAVKHGERTLEAGLHREGAALARLGVDRESISFGSAAGGDRADQVTPRAAVQLLRIMSARPDFSVYRDALPVLGRDGTLAKISTNHPAAGQVQAKTGTLIWENVLNDANLLTAKGLAGYLTAKSGRRFAFAAFVNLVPHGKEPRVAREGEALGRLCEVIFDAN